MGQYLAVAALIVLAGSLRRASPRRVGFPQQAQSQRRQGGSVRVRHRADREPPTRFPVGFYLVAMLFIMFDIEIVFLYPCAVSRQTLGGYGFFEVVSFSVSLLPGHRVRRGQRCARLGSDAAAPVPRVRFPVSARRQQRCGASGSRVAARRQRVERRPDGTGRVPRAWLAWTAAQLHHRQAGRPGGLGSSPLVVAAHFGLACCAIEMMGAGALTTTWPASAWRSSAPHLRQADILIVVGSASRQKMAPAVARQTYDQMMDPKWVISMGVCASTGGMFNNYAIVQGVRSDRAGRRLLARLPSHSRRR